MILPNNPAIDVDELMGRVRADAARIRDSGAIEKRRGEPRDPGELTLARALDRHRAVSALLDQAERENRPRTSVPRRITAIRVLAPAVKLALRMFNYAFKGQREFNTSIVRADRELIRMQTIVGEAVARLTQEVRSLERFRTETVSELQAVTTALQERLVAVEHAHLVTRERADVAHGRTEFAHGRIDEVAGRVEFSHQRVDSAETTIGAVSARLDGLPTRAEARLDIVDALRDVERRLATAVESLLRNDALLRSELLAFRSDPGATVASGDGDAPISPRASDALHAALGDRFRGDRDVVAERLAAYVPILHEAGTVSAACPLLDIGSGRGEFLATLRDEGLAGFGSEQNVLLAQQAHQAGLDVRPQDGLQILRDRAPGTLGAVTAFHVVEHLTFDELCDLLALAQRALVPGGVLILETPDPRNIVVSTRTFYLDPTHRHPLPAELLEFLVASFGYAGIAQLELHAPDAAPFPADDRVGELLNTYFARAQDYAIVARAPRE